MIQSKSIVKKWLKFFKPFVEPFKCGKHLTFNIPQPLLLILD